LKRMKNMKNKYTIEVDSRVIAVIQAVLNDDSVTDLLELNNGKMEEHLSGILSAQVSLMAELTPNFQIEHPKEYQGIMDLMSESEPADALIRRAEEHLKRFR
jgi:hypothetical protein